MASPECSITGCSRSAHCRGWCKAHYEKWRLRGDPEWVRPPAFPENLLQRMEPQPNGCIYFTGALDKDGYGQITRQGKSTKAHRAAYEHFVGPIPEGHQIDHECHNRDETCAGGPTCEHRRCVNFEHLRTATAKENLLASSATWGGRNARKTHCPQGHPYDDENTRINSQGSRVCLTCLRVSQRRQNQRKWEQERAARTHCPRGHPYDDENTHVDPRGRRVCRACLATREPRNTKRRKKK